MKGMCQLFNGIRQGSNNMLLPDQLFEVLRAPLSSGNFKIHGYWDELSKGEKEAELLGNSQHTWDFATAASFRI